MLELVEIILKDYALPIVTIIGAVELVKGIKRKGFKKQHILQMFFSLIWAIKSVGIVEGWYTALPWTWLTMLSLTTLFWDFFFKKIKKIGAEDEGK